MARPTDPYFQAPPFQRRVSGGPRTRTAAPQSYFSSSRGTVPVPPRPKAPPPKTGPSTDPWAPPPSGPMPPPLPSPPPSGGYPGADIPGTPLPWNPTPGPGTAPAPPGFNP